MRRPIFFKFFTGFLIATLTLAVLILAASYQAIKSHSIGNIEQNLERMAIPLREVIAPILDKSHAPALNAVARRYAPLFDLRITIIDRDGTVLGDSERDPAAMENHADRPEVAGALSGATGRSIRYSTTLDEDLLYIAVPVQEKGRAKGVLRLSVPLRHISELMNRLVARLAGLTVLIILLSSLLSAVYSHYLSTPVRALSKAAVRIASGDLAARVTPGTDDEIRDLTEVFNEMALKLERSFSEVRARNEELEGIVSSITELLLVLDARGRVMLSNAAARRIILSETIQGRYYWELLRSTRLNSLMEEAATGPVSGEVEIADKIYLCSVTPLASRQAKVVLLHDITEMKRIELIKRDLAVNVSHELRTPLTAIKGFTETLMDDADPGSLEYLQIILRHTDRLIAMVNDLLVLSEIEERPSLVFSDVNIEDLVKNVLAIYEPKIRNKGLDITVECSPATIRADAFRLEQVLTNLVENALRYTEKGGIRISTEVMEGGLVMKVRDTGIGIPREHLSRVFERFYVADRSRSRQMGGTGLGLSIAKHIVTLHGGRIEVESTPYMGTTFTVTLPDRK